MGFGQTGQIDVGVYVAVDDVKGRGVGRAALLGKKREGGLFYATAGAQYFRLLAEGDRQTRNPLGGTDEFPRQLVGQVVGVNHDPFYPGGPELVQPDQ